MTDNLYLNMLYKLKNMTEKQLLEMFKDIEDIVVIERIADCAYHFVENFEPDDSEPFQGKSDEQEWKEQDDAQRCDDIKST